MYSIICIFFILFNLSFGNVNLPPSGWDLIILSSARGNSIKRLRRQDPIVQPNWSFNSDVSLFEDYNVRVTEENLEETEAIREYIHETVENGTYVVELDEGDFENDETSINEKTPIEELAQPEAEFEIPVESSPEPIHNPSQTLEPIPPKPKPNNKTVNVPPSFLQRLRIKPKRKALGVTPFFSWLKKGFSIRSKN